MSRRARTGVALVIACTMWTGCSEDPPPKPTVAIAKVVRGDMAVHRGDVREPVQSPVRVEDKATAETAKHARGVVELDNGAWALLDGGTKIEVALGRVTVRSGRLWMDASRAATTTVETEHGTLRTEDAAFAVALREGSTHVYCGSGEITWKTEGNDGRVMRGEKLVLGKGEPSAEPADMWDDWTGGVADPAPDAPQGASHVGMLSGREPDAYGEARTRLPIRAHEVDVDIRGELAVTEVVQTFFNARSEPLEAVWRMRLPRGALVDGFAVDRDGNGFEQADIRSMDTKDAYGLPWESSADASTEGRLAYAGPHRVRARIHPIAPGATVRVKLRYTEWLQRRGDTRTYVCPMNEGRSAPLIGELVLRAETRAEEIAGYRAGMGAEVKDAAVVLRRSDFRPRADFYLDIVDEKAPDSSRATAYLVSAEESQPGSGDADRDGEAARYALFDVPTRGLETQTHDDDGKEPPLQLVMLVDVSGATPAAELELSRMIVDAVLQQLPPGDRVAVRVADVQARTPEGAPAQPVEVTEKNREALLESLASVPLGGATDLGASLQQAARLVEGSPRGAVLYLGDGLPTTGALDATALRQELRSLQQPPRMFALGVGEDANMGLLRALFGDEAQQVADRTEASRAVMHLLADAARPMLRDVSLQLGENIERAYPQPPLEVAAGHRLRVVGRLRGPMPKQITLRGRADGQSFERAIAVRRSPYEADDDVRRRWGAARLQQLLDEGAGREALVALGLRFELVTPWTALAVDGGDYDPVRGFDEDPYDIAWGLGGGAQGLRRTTLGGTAAWKRRMSEQRPSTSPSVAPEQTWVERVDADAAGASAQGDGGLANAVIRRALRERRGGPRGCYERKLTVQPDLSGDVTVAVEVDGDGSVRAVRTTQSSLGASDVVECIRSEVRGIRYPATDAATPIEITHTFQFDSSGRQLGTNRECSDAADRALAIRRLLWKQRLQRWTTNVDGVLKVWSEARASCELPDWRSRRALLDVMLAQLDDIDDRIALHDAFEPGSSMATHLRRTILRGVETPEEVVAAREGLGVEAPVDWSVFAAKWKADRDPEARLALVQRWLEVAPDDIALRLRQLSLLEQLDRLGKARRLARELRADPLADARVRTAVGEFWLRQDDQAQARRAFSEIVEHAPLDPWARRRLGDVYRAHGWNDDAYREYRTLARLRPNDVAVWLSLARAAADAGRIDEALRLQKRVSETVAPDAGQGPPAHARAWTRVRLARLRARTEDDDRLAALDRRARRSGALRDPPALFAALTWPHPGDSPELHLQRPSTPEDVGWERAPLQGDRHGIEAVRIVDREDGAYRFRVHRTDPDRIRNTKAELLVVLGPGTAEPQIHREPIELTREARDKVFALEGETLAAK